MHVHIEGMGVTGSLIAHRLAQAGVQFTWHDTEQPVNAWRASTGAIYPSGSEKFGPDEQCRHQWLRWQKDGFLHDEADPVLEMCEWVYCTKSAPHDGRYTWRPWGQLKIADPVHLQLNAQALVQKTRDQFAAERRETTEPGADWHIVAHGWGQRLGHLYWGWTRLVRLQYDDSRLVDGRRPAFYFRQGRFVMTYAYPVPGTPWWYAGSSIIKQPKERPNELGVVDKYDRWRENFLRLGAGQVAIVDEGKFFHGWRPAARGIDDRWVTQRHNTLTVRPLWNSGIRHFPLQWAGVAQALNLPEGA